MKALLITGGAGFIGSNFVPYFLETYPEYELVVLDLLTYAGDLELLKKCEENDRYQFVKGDICDRVLVELLFLKHDIRGVLHFAAESHVDNSITGPEVFIDTNVKGTFNLVHAAKEHWMEGPFQVKGGYEDCRFLHVSTDEVYGSLGETGLFTETTPYAPNSPYSASKASADMLVRSYQQTFGLNAVITNCGNNYGPKQHREKLIPKIISNALSHQPIPIYGDGRNSRDWIYVLDHCRGVDDVFHKGESGEVYNIGSNNERDNLYIVDKICSILDHLKPSNEIKSYKHLITFVEDRAGHDRRYAIDATKIKTQLGWQPEVSFDDGLRLTVEWYLKQL